MVDLGGGGGWRVCPTPHFITTNCLPPPILTSDLHGIISIYKNSRFGPQDSQVFWQILYFHMCPPPLFLEILDLPLVYVCLAVLTSYYLCLEDNSVLETLVKLILGTKLGFVRFDHMLCHHPDPMSFIQGQGQQ